MLIERAVAEIARFTGGAAVALYREIPGGYASVAGETAGLPALLDADEPPLVAMRADRGIVRDAFASGALALPMIHRADVTGIVLLGPKPGGDPYRTDEEEQLTDAVRRIGLDLYALRVDELEAANTLLSTRLAAVAA